MKQTFRETGFAHVLLIIFLLASIPIGLYLVQKTQIFKPKAYDANINRLETFNTIGDALNAYQDSPLGQQQIELKKRIDDIALEQRIVDVEEDQAYKNLYGQDRKTLLKEIFDIPETTPDDEIDPTIKRALNGSGVVVEGDITGSYNVKLPEGCFEGSIDSTGNQSPTLCAINPEILVNLGTSAIEFLFGDFIQLYELQQKTGGLNKQVLDLFSRSGINDRSNSSDFDFSKDDDLTIRSKFLEADLNNYPDDTLTPEQKEARDELREVFPKYADAYYDPQNHLRYMTLLDMVFGKVIGEVGVFAISKLPSTPLVLNIGDKIRNIGRYKVSKEGEEVIESLKLKLEPEEAKLADDWGLGAKDLDETPSRVENVVDEIPIVVKIAPDSVFKDAVRLYPEADYVKGVYTEIHLDSKGQVYVVPEFVRGEVHYASLSGTHSMFEAKRVGRAQLNSGQLEFVDSLSFDTDTMVAKGTLFRDDASEFSLVIDPFYIRSSVYASLKKNPVSDNLKISLFADITKVKDSMGIKNVRESVNGNPIIVKIGKGQTPKINYENVRYFYHGDNPGNESIRSGFIGFYFDYTQRRNSVSRLVDSQEEISVSTVTEIGFNLNEVAARTHQEAIATVFSKADAAVLDDALKLGFSMDNITSHSLMGRHTVDLRNKQVQINLGIDRVTDISELQDLEYTFFSAYLKTLNEHNPELRDYTLTLITSYTNNEGQSLYRTLRIPFNLVVNDFSDPGRIFYAMLARRK